MSPPPERLPRGRHGLPRAFIVENQRERILAGVAEAIAEKGFRAVSVEDVVRRSGVSRRTFYSLFTDKEEAFFASFDAVNAHVQASMAKAFLSADEWPEQVRRGLGALLEFVGREPAFAKMGFVEMAAAGPEGQRRHDASLMGFELFLQPGLALAKHPVPSYVPRMVGGGISELLTSHVLRGEGSVVSELLPAAVYLCLVSYLGPAAAWHEASLAEQ
jgi:AcrR family transcriptional regulator